MAATPRPAEVVLLVVVALLVAAVAFSSPWTAATQRADSRVDSDFQILHAAGRGLAEGRDIHDPAVLDEIGRRDGRQATPFCAANPLVVAAYGLLADRDVQSAYRIGLLVNVGLAVLAVIWLAGLARVLGAAGTRGTSPWLALACGLAALGLGESLWMSLAMNSTNLLALVAMLGALRAACAGRPALEGACLAVALVAKTSPALMLLVLALAGRWRAALWAVVATVVLGGLSIAWSGWAVHESWLVNVMPALGYAPELTAGSFNNSLHTWNLSPNGVLSRAMLQADAPRLFALLGAWLVTGMIFVQLYGALRKAPVGRAGSADGSRTPEATRARVREYALGATAMLLVSSVTWPHHLVFLAIPTVWLLWRVLRPSSERGPMGATCVGLLCVALLALPLGTLDRSPDLALAIPVRTVALVVLFAVLVVREPESGGSSAADDTAPPGAPA